MIKKRLLWYKNICFCSQIIPKKICAYFECLSGMENVINKPCLCQLKQAICCLPKPLSEQRKQIFLVERGAESPTGADWSCVLSNTIPLLESVRRQDFFLLCGREENVCYQPVIVAQPKDKTRIGKSDACTQVSDICALVSTLFPAFPVLAGWV